MSLLAGKVAVITGASSGIGRAIALKFAAEGAALVLNARGEVDLQDLADQITSSGGKAVAVAGDVARAETHERIVQQAKEVLGGIDIAVNNAGIIGPFKPLADVSVEEWNQPLSVNLTGSFLGARAQIPALIDRGGGALIFVSSFVGTSAGMPGMTPYAASKAGLMGLVKGITAEYATQSIRANALLPGGTDTPAAGDQARKDWAAGLHALKRIARPDEIANAALFLASPMASFVAGSALYADGGNAAVK